MIKDCKAIIFDADDVLMDNRQPISRAGDVFTDELSNIHRS